MIGYDEDKETEELPETFDKIIVLMGGIYLLGKIVDSRIAIEKEMICIHRPMEIFDNIDNGDIYLREWMPFSIDDFYFVPASKILTISTPDAELIDNYYSAINHNNNLEEEEIKESDDKNKPFVH